MHERNVAVVDNLTHNLHLEVQRPDELVDANRVGVDKVVARRLGLSAAAGGASENDDGPGRVQAGAVEVVFLHRRALDEPHVPHLGQVFANPSLRQSGNQNYNSEVLRQVGSPQRLQKVVQCRGHCLPGRPGGDNDVVLDEPYCMNIPGSGQWCPENYTRKHYGTVTLTQALKDSLNVPAVKVSESVGRENVRKVAEDFGIKSDLALGPALALGASESTLLEMTGAYAGILNGGSAVKPYGLIELRLLGDREPLMGAGGGIGERVIQERAARSLTYMMENPRNITACTHLLFMAKNVERIGDHCTNIAEIVYVQVTGESLGDARPKGDRTSLTLMEPPQ